MPTSKGMDLHDEGLEEVRRTYDPRLLADEKELGGTDRHAASLTLRLHA